MQNEKIICVKPELGTLWDKEIRRTTGLLARRGCDSARPAAASRRPPERLRGVCAYCGDNIAVGSIVESWLTTKGERNMASRDYWLTPPTRLTFILSVVLVILALLVRYAHVSVPVVSEHVFETLLIGYLVLLAGNLLRGL